jgi:hypothetical protein
MIATSGNNSAFKHCCMIVVRNMLPKCYSKPERIYLCSVKKAASRFLTQIPRGATREVPGPGTCTEAEIKPVEPDQGNACAGKEVPTCIFLSPLRSISDSIFKPLK